MLVPHLLDIAEFGIEIAYGLMINFIVPILLSSNLHNIEKP